MRDLLTNVRDVLGTELFNLGDDSIFLSEIVLGLIVLIATLIVAKLVERAIARAFRRLDSSDEGSAGVASRLGYYVALVLGLGIALHSMGIQLSALFAAGAIFAVGIGFGLQNVVQNFVSGIIILAERAIKPSDILEVEGEMVKVVHMGLRATIARTLDEEDIIVPNSVLVQSTVKNLTLRDPLYRLRVPVGVSYSSDLDQVLAVLEEVAASVQKDPARKPVVVLTGFGSSSIDFEASIWINDPWSYRRIRSQLALAVWRALRDAGIVIAFPQLDLHVDRELLDAMGER